MAKNKTKAIIILDGLGNADNGNGNAVALANTPVLDKLRNKYPKTLIGASGRAVGLPDGQMGNSEVGHTNIGAGRVVYQDSVLISKEIETGEFFTNSALIGAVENCKSNNSTFHIMGLASSGGVHSRFEHLMALIDLAIKNGLKNVYLHLITDGRDVPPKSANEYIRAILEKIEGTAVKIGTIVGRYNIMDRDNNWDRVKKGYDNLMMGKGVYFENPIEAVENSYNNGITDEFIEPIVIGDYDGVNENDSIIFFNFRTDRPKEITKAILFKDFNEFERECGYKKVYYVCMTQYDQSFNSISNCHVAYPPREVKNTFGEYISKQGLTQLRIAEIEKYAHVTFFFNGGTNDEYENERRVLIPSPKVATYDLKPEMSAYEVTDALLAEIDKGIDVIILNFANPDMVGHTGQIPATIKAVEVVDECLGKVLDKILSIGGEAIVTADHGNAEKMILEDGSPCTSHTTNLVELFLVSDKHKNIKLREGGCLGDIAPTMLELMNLEKPEEMTGESLIKTKDTQKLVCLLIFFMENFLCNIQPILQCFLIQ